MKIHLLPVYSKLAAPDLLERVRRGRILPADFQLSEHQALTLEALEDPETQIVFNTAITGDGKSLAAYLAPLIGPAQEDSIQQTILGLYPTNELSKDQEQQFKGYQTRFGTHLKHTSLWGDRLTELAGDERGGRANSLIELLGHNQVMLTNPDIFIRMLNYQYHSGIYTPQEIPYKLLTYFSLLLFDEFHLFTMPQFAAAATALVYAQELDPHHAPKALFSSATQHQALVTLIQRAGLKMRTLEGAYAPAGASPAELSDSYRQILHPADLHLHQLSGEQTMESWVREHVDLITDAWRDGQPARAAIIVSSVATAHRLAGFLREALGFSPLKPGGWRVEEVTGLSHGSLDADIVVGTSTIDVGIDFHINLLIFEALNAGQFLQRLGRLGRVHQGKEDFQSYTAHALISAKTPWVGARLVEALRERGVEDGGAANRPETLRAAVEVSYPAEADFALYVRRWGALQGFHIVRELKRLHDYGQQENTYASVIEPLEARYAQLYDLKSLNSLAGRYFRLNGKKSSPEKALLEEVLSFRGSSPFQVALWDARGRSTDDQFQPYDLFWLMKTTEWALVPYTAFKERLRAACASDEEFNRRLRAFAWVLEDAHKQPLCLRINAYLEERERLRLSLDRSLEDEGLLDRPVVSKRFRVEQPRNNHARDAINEVLKRHEVVCYVTRTPSAELFRRYHLPALFPVYQVDVNHIPVTCAVAFGKHALLLDSLARWRRRAGAGDHQPIIF